MLGSGTALTVTVQVPTTTGSSNATIRPDCEMGGGCGAKKELRSAMGRIGGGLGDALGRSPLLENAIAVNEGTIGGGSGARLVSPLKLKSSCCAKRKLAVSIRNEVSKLWPCATFPISIGGGTGSKTFRSLVVDCLKNDAVPLKFEPWKIGGGDGSKVGSK